jgi:hypothetical protein
VPAHDADLARRRKNNAAELFTEHQADQYGPARRIGAVPAPRQAPEAEPELLSHPEYRSAAHRVDPGPSTERWWAVEPEGGLSPGAERAALSGSGRHSAVGRRRRVAVGGFGWRRIALAALAVLLVVLLGYGAVVALQGRPTSDDRGAPAPAPALVPTPAAPAPATPPTPAAPTPPQNQPDQPRAAAPPTAAPSARTGTPPASMLARPGQRSGNSEELTLPSGSAMTVFDNFPMSGASSVTRAVVVVHGTGRNAEGYYQRAVAAAKSAGVTDHTMVVAPWFKGDDGDKVASGEASWSNDAWKQGYPAESGSQVSSFTAMDNIMATLADKRRFPKLTHITLTGHSAGGQFTQRYAAFGKAPNVLNWVDFNFAVMNPSSYVYFDDARPGKSGSFSVPSSSSCKDYNQYKYGLDGRQSYPGQLSAAAALAQYASRQVTIFNGGADTVDNGDLDTDCGAMLQGANRELRGQYFFNHFKALEPQAPHKRIVVPGVDHDSEAMLGSPLAAATLFGSSR